MIFSVTFELPSEKLDGPLEPWAVQHFHILFMLQEQSHFIDNQLNLGIFDKVAKSVMSFAKFVLYISPANFNLYENQESGSRLFLLQR